MQAPLAIKHYLFLLTSCFIITFASIEDGEIDMDNDWKLLTLLIGGNDLCDR